jgi:F-type H+-transporting ATPase subunit b
MLRALTAPQRLWLPTLFVALAVALSGARAEDKPAGHESHGTGPAPVYQAEVHQDGQEVTRVFDFAKPEDASALTEMLREGHVHELALKETPGLAKIFSLGADLGLWTLVVFGLLFYVLQKYAWPKMLSGLQKREESIHGAIEEAKKTRDEAHKLHEQLQGEMAQAQDKVRGIMDDARRNAEATTADMIAKARTEIQTERDRLHREIQSETDQALQSLWTRAADLATMISSKAIGKQLDGDSQRRLIDEALTEIRQGANGHA